MKKVPKIKRKMKSGVKPLKTNNYVQPDSEVLVHDEEGYFLYKIFTAQSRAKRMKKKFNNKKTRVRTGFAKGVHHD